MRREPRPPATALGLAAIVFWSATVAVFRSLSEQLDVFSAGALAYLSAGALYSDVGRRWGADSGDGCMAVFLLAVGLVLLGARFVDGEHSHFTGRVLLAAGYMIVFPTLLAYGAAQE